LYDGYGYGYKIVEYWLL